MPRRISEEALAELKQALKGYEREVEEACMQGRLHLNTSLHYVGQARTFLRWLEGKYEPGRRSRPSIRPRSSRAMQQSGNVP
jgi:hypothetical protein